MSSASAGALVDEHRDTLEKAVAAIRERGYWSAFPESPSPKVYGESAAGDGKAAFEAYLGSQFPLDQPGTTDWTATERSPYGIELDIRYPRCDLDTLLAAAQTALPAWRDAGPHVRAGVCLEILHRLNNRSFEMANAVMFTTGQAFVMAFQAGAAHAQERGVEAVAYAHDLMTRYTDAVTWEKPQRKGDPLRVDKSFRVVPRGIACVIGCNTFPTWNGYPGLFASLVTGNPVVVKPHPRAVLPLAITVHAAREVLAGSGFDPNLVTLVAEGEEEKIAGTLARRPDVRVIDFTGSSEFGSWLEQHAVQAAVHTEKAGVNVVVIDSTDDYRGMLGNLAFSLSLYSGQMCTTPQNLLIGRDGIDTDQGHKSPEEVCADLAAAIQRLLGDADRATGILGAIVNDAVLDRLERAEGLGKVVLASRAIDHPEFPNAVVRTPLVVALEETDQEIYGREHFGPITFAVTTENTQRSLDIMGRIVGGCGALTAMVYSTDQSVLAAAERTAVEAGVNLSENLTGQVFVNQSAAFSDYHGTGANPAASSSLTDPGFVAGRFHFVEIRRPAAATGSDQ